MAEINLAQHLSSEQLNEWYHHEPGAAILQIEEKELQKVLAEHFGYYLLQLGTPPNQNFLSASPIHQHIVLAPDNAYATTSDGFIQSDFVELPIQNSSIDLAILFHTLEFVAEPQTVLQEIYNTLIPGGSAIIFCFNCHSLLGLTKLGKNKQTAPWQGKFISPWRMRSWLNKTGFTVGDYQSFFFRPPLQNKYLLQKLKFLETIGQFFWPYFGSSYMFVAKKMLVGMHLLVAEEPVATLISSPSTAPRYNNNISIKCKN